MNVFKRFFHFLGGIYFAISLIAIAALLVIVGTILESKTDSHLLAAQWTYEHPFFVCLLGLFFVNILFSALRRWPFKKKHIPFLMTHLGLLMIIGGTILKNRLGVQGQLSVWEGSGNQSLLLPHTFALSIEEKNDSLPFPKKSFVAFDSFQSNIYYPFHFPQLKCKLMGYAPHVKESLETWIKDTKAYIAGFPPLPVHEWKPSELFPQFHSYPYALNADSQSWSLLALRTSSVQHALQQAYLQELDLLLKSKYHPEISLKIPLKQALETPFSFANGTISAELHLLYPVLDDQDISFLTLHWQSLDGKKEEKATIALQGQDALYIKSDPHSWLESSFTVDMIRPLPRLLFVDDEQGNTLLLAFDRHGRVHLESFSSSNVQTLLAYDQGFQGYGIQATVPIPSFSTSREDKERASTYELKMQLKQALQQNPTLAPPLHFFEQACQQAQVDFIENLIEFLTEWNASPGFIFHPVRPFSPQLELVLLHLNWQAVSLNDQQASQWTRQLLNQLAYSLEEGDHPLIVLERNHWPFLSELQHALHSTEHFSPLNVLAQQVSSLIRYLPPLTFPSSLSLLEQAQLLSAYFRAYGIDYRSLCPFRGSDKEQFHDLENYWKAQEMSEQHNLQQAIVFETTLTHRITPVPAPIKLEDCRPGIVLEVQKGQQKQTIALAYDSSGTGLKWPLLNGHYIVRFQPKLKELPYRIRLRQARQISYPQSPQVYSYESDLLISENGKEPEAHTLSMNHVHETWDGYRFYLAGVATSSDSNLKRIQLAVNHDPAKYLLTYPGAILVFLGTVLLFWIWPYRKK